MLNYNLHFLYKKKGRGYIIFLFFTKIICFRIVKNKNKKREGDCKYFYIIYKKNIKGEHCISFFFIPSSTRYCFFLSYLETPPINLGGTSPLLSCSCTLALYCGPSSFTSPAQNKSKVCLLLCAAHFQLTCYSRNLDSV